MAENTDPTPTPKRRSVLPAVIGGSVAGLLLLAGVFAGGAALGYGIGFTKGTHSANSNANWPPRDRPNWKPSQGPGESRDRSPVGEWRGDLSSGKKDAVRLTLASNGEASSNDGCNGGSAQWELKGAQIHFKDFVSTKMFCEGVDTYLYDTRVAELSKDGSKLLLLDAKGKEIGELNRTAGNGGIVPPLGSPDPRPSTDPDGTGKFDSQERMREGMHFRDYENLREQRKGTGNNE